MNGRVELRDDFKLEDAHPIRPPNDLPFSYWNVFDAERSADELRKRNPRASQTIAGELTATPHEQWQPSGLNSLDRNHFERETLRTLPSRRLRSSVNRARRGADRQERRKSPRPPKPTQQLASSWMHGITS
jgi:hypothetical protein